LGSKRKSLGADEPSRLGEAALVQIPGFFILTNLELLIDEWIPEQSEPAHAKAFGEARHPHQPGLHGTPAVNALMVWSTRVKRGRRRLEWQCQKDSKVRFKYWGIIPHGIPPYFLGLSAFPPLGAKSPIIGEGRWIQIHQSFPIDQTKLEQTIDRTLVVGWPNLIPVIASAAVRDPEVIRQTVERPMSSSQLDRSRTEVAFAAIASRG
jgi:hypothetical protein